MNRKGIILASLAAGASLAVVVHVGTASGSEPPGRLVVNGDGTVTDTVTRLLWQQGTSPYTAATCSTLTLGTHGAGTWRVPTVKEVASIVDYESPTAPVIDTVAFTGYSSFSPALTTSTPNVYVNFTTGVISANGNCCNSPIVRCVQTLP